MKRLIILVSALTLSGTMFAQKATADNPFSLEGIVNYNGNDGLNWSAPSLRMRYFVKDNIAARLTVDFGSGAPAPSTESNNVYGTTTAEMGTQDIKRSSINVGIGGEYHLTGTDRMSPYFSGGVGFGNGSYSETWTNFDGSGSAPVYSAGLTAAVDGSYSTFGFNLGAGLDYYVAENIYVGMELGFGWSKMSYDDGTTSVLMNGVSVYDATTASYTQTYTTLGQANAALRLGWRF
jgi:opacity protein-like surface antigen